MTTLTAKVCAVETCDHREGSGRARVILCERHAATYHWCRACGLYPLPNGVGDPAYGYEGRCAQCRAADARADAEYERERDEMYTELDAQARERVAVLRAEYAGNHRKGCEIAFIDSTRGGMPIARRCGDQNGGYAVMCDSCERFYARQYPQGWRGYPGDTCEHGRYVGGSGADYMCGACESA